MSAPEYVEFTVEERQQREREAARWAKDVMNSISFGMAPEVSFVGQEKLKSQVEPFFTGRFPPTLITGVPGTGKTQFAKWIASQRNEAFHEMLCPVKVEEIPSSGVIILDEAHLQKKPEPLFRMMTDNVTVTILAATTRPELLEPAFKTRFFLRVHIDRYDVNDMKLVIRHFTNNTEVWNEHPEWLDLYAGASAGNPRQAERIIMTAKALDNWEPELVLSTCRINSDGLTDVHIDYLRVLADMGRPVGLSQLAYMLSQDEQTIREAERFLIRDLKLVALTSSGRLLSAKGHAYITEFDR